MRHHPSDESGTTSYALSPAAAAAAAAANAAFAAFAATVAALDLSWWLQAGLS